MNPQEKKAYDELYPPLVITHVGGMPSDWIKEGTEKDANPECLAGPGIYFILPTSKVKEENGPGYEKIRYIMNCPSIYPEWQDKNGYKPSANGADKIIMKDRSMTIRREGSYVYLYDYIKLYQGNASNKRRPDEAEVEFEEVIEKNISAKNTSNFEAQLEAMNILRQLREVEEDGKFTYNTDNLTALSRFFKLDHLSTPDQIFEQLTLIAAQTPSLIVNSLFNSKKQMMAYITKADALNVLTFEDERVVFSDTKQVILPYQSKLNKNTQMKRLADFFLTDEGGEYYLQLKLSVDKAGVKSLEPVS